MPSDFAFVLFGATGDLSRKKIIPALYELFLKDTLPSKWTVICFIRKSWQQAELAEYISGLLPQGAKVLEFASRFIPLEGDLSEIGSFIKLQGLLAEINAEKTAFYLSISPSLYKGVIANLKESKAAKASSSVLIEKPFGRCMQDAKELTELLESFLDPSQILRVDHYLGKDAMGEAAEVNRGDAAEVAARFIEDKTIGERGAFYDSIGAFLDVGQNHMLMMIATALKALRGGSRLDALKSLTVLPKGCIRGQYDTYRNEKDVKAGSSTETYFKVLFHSDGAEITMLGGKGFGQKSVDINVSYNDGTALRINFSSEAGESLEPHAKVILAMLRQDESMFVSKEEAFEEWRIAEDALRALRSTELRVYPKGTDYKNV